MKNNHVFSSNLSVAMYENKSAVWSRCMCEQNYMPTSICGGGGALAMVFLGEKIVQQIRKNKQFVQLLVEKNVLENVRSNRLLRGKLVHTFRAHLARLLVYTSIY